MSKKRKVLILTNHRKDRSPGQRFRFEQYLSALEGDGCEIDFSVLLKESDDKIFYSKGNYFNKAIILLKTFIKRFKQIFTVNNYDVVLIFREAYFTGTSFFERAYRKKSKAKFIFDFDDAIWIEAESVANKKFNWLKNSLKTADIISVCDTVMAGNQYLKEYALAYCENVVIVPTTIDTEEYKKTFVNKPANKICIGWSGSFSTIEHFETILKVLKEVKNKFGDKVYFKVIGDAGYYNKDLDIQGIGWSKRDEIKELSEIDIGIMPLPDNDWARGKCGLKGLQYMALEIPTIMSPVGVNTEIIQDGVNGFLAAGTDEWLEKLSTLIENEKKRFEMGLAGRKTVEKNYSVIANKALYLGIFK